jgi:TonB family protein
MNRPRLLIILIYYLLKKRIKMMNKRRTSEMGKAKYLLFAPLAGVLLMVSNIESVAREIGEQLPEVAEVQQKAEQALNADVAVANPTAEEAKAAAEAKKAEEAKAAELAKSEAELKAEAKASDATAPADTTKNVVYDVTETLPQFPGGQGVMLKYLADNIKYPASAVKAKKQGRVIVGFIVQKDGSITHAKIVRSIDPELDAEALRVVKGMPKWTPGTQLGKPVSVKYTLPVKFSLQKDATPGKKK